MRVTYVIGYRHKPDRIMNLRKVLDWLSGFNNMDIMLVEQDTHSKISHLNLRAKHIFVKSSKPYNRSWAFNVALRYNKNPIIIFGDSDLVMDPEELIKSINEISNYDVVSPYSIVLDLNPEETNYPFDMLPKINRPGRGENDNQKINLCGGIVIFRAESVVKIGGWSEIFESWGGEDDFQTHKVKRLGLTYKEMPYKCYHLWHDRTQVDMAEYQKVLNTLQQLTSLDDTKLVTHINSSITKLGLLNKHSIYN
jgi:glycosyltransferase involved in cell wall biosynthesis